MYIKVQLLSGFQEPLWYVCPQEWGHQSLVGSLVQVPFRTQRVSALVLNEQHTKPQVSFQLRQALSIETVPEDPHYVRFITILSAYYQIHPITLFRRIRQFLRQKEQHIEPPLSKETPFAQTVTLTADQKHIVDTITPYLTSSQFFPALLHGVTGSGKTEVYKEIMQHVINHHKSVMFLLPEVALACAFEKRLLAEMPTMPIISFHSATSVKHKRLLWQHLLEKKPCIIIGVHLPILLPIPHLACIIVDEEHDGGYQEKQHPKIHTKEAALLRAQQAHIPIILGSATPSLNSLHSVKHTKWHFFSLPERFGGSFPAIQTVLLNDKKARKHFWISNELYHALQDRLIKKEQTIIFLNRRGHSFFVQCVACSFIPMCPSCSVSLTLHMTNTLHCHYCDYHLPMPTRCVECNTTEFLKKGIGTQQVVTVLQQLFPHATIERADLDTTKKKKEWHTILTKMHEGTIDILVGTQTVTKGYHFPRVTLVGILWADLNLHFPLFNAAETTLQQLIQVAGRAGRESSHSNVIVQAMDDHTIFSYLDEQSYLSFYQHEYETRKLLGYPPSQRLVELELKNSNEVTLQRDADYISVLLHTTQQRKKIAVTILGPAKPPIHKIKNWHIRKIYLKSASFKLILDLYAHVKNIPLMSSIHFTPNPIR